MYLTINCTGTKACYHSNFTVDQSDHVLLGCEGVDACSRDIDEVRSSEHVIQNTLTVLVLCVAKYACADTLGTISESAFVEMLCIGGSACLMASLVICTLNLTRTYLEMLIFVV